MSPTGMKLGILLSTAPEQTGFQHGVRLAAAALTRGVEVYLYCIDDAVLGVTDARLQALRASGLRLFACAYAAQARHLPQTDHAVFAGLGVVSDLLSATDRFVSFNSDVGSTTPHEPSALWHRLPTAEVGSCSRRTPEGSE